MVGLRFNPSNDADADFIKTQNALVIDRLISLRDKTDDPEKKLLLSIAITERQGAMWAAKAVTCEEGQL